MGNILDVPKPMNMGFHYTQQYSRRTRVNVMGLVDHSTEEWTRWYYKTHEAEALEKMDSVGYKLIEIHFMYGFGIEGEKSEYELTKKMVENAHKVGIKVLGYLQFFSVQKELFFLENPWAEQCLQLKVDGTPHTYAYDRPALCFTNQKVRDYYLKSIEIGIDYCGLDGIRLDNDYYQGCYCQNCQKEFKEYLQSKFSTEEAMRVFGLETLEGMELVPTDLTAARTIRDPLAGEMVKFRMLQRQKIMKLLYDKIVSLKPDAIFGGNPAICRTLTDSMRVHVYIPDLGETHHLVCSENSLFPARTGDSIRHQVVAYKHGQANDFKVFASHHLYYPGGTTRWPETIEECSLSLCEALAFGGHVPCTTWGIRMDGTADKTLYERPYFLESLIPLAGFLEENEHIYEDAVCDAQVGIYINRESQIYDAHQSWSSLQGMIQLLVSNKIPFKFVDTDDDEKLKDVKVLLIGNVSVVSDSQFNRFQRFAKKNKVVITGRSCAYDDFNIERNPDILESFLKGKNVIFLKSAPESIEQKDLTFRGRNYLTIPLPIRGEEFIKALGTIYKPSVKVVASQFIAIDVSKNNKGEMFIHVLNYDNASPQKVEIQLPRTSKVNVQTTSPKSIGYSSTEKYEKDGRTHVILRDLHTYAVVRVMENNI